MSSRICGRVPIRRTPYRTPATPSTASARSRARSTSCANAIWTTPVVKIRMPETSCAKCSHRAATLRPCGDPRGTAHARAAKAAIAVGILGEVLLVIILRVIELGRGKNFRRDRTVAGLRQERLIRVARALGRVPLCRVVVVDAGAILRARVVALPHALGRVVAFPEHFQQILVPNHLRIEDDEHDLGVAGQAAAHLAVRRVRRVAGRVADCGGIDAGQFPELPLGAPETPHCEDRALEASGKRRLEAMSTYKMGIWHSHPGVASWQCVML